MWVHEGDGKEKFSDTHGYGQLHQPHKAVHYHVQQALLLSDGNWQKDASLRDEIIAEMNQAELTSNQVLQAIDQMIDEKRH
jgi:hypothetical protein